MWKVWVFWLAVFLRAAAAAPAGSEPASPLAGLCNRTTEPEYIVEHPEICQNFISCSFGRLINEWVCDEGKAWVRGHCDLPNPGRCKGQLVIVTSQNPG